MFTTFHHVQRAGGVVPRWGFLLFAVISLAWGAAAEPLYTATVPLFSDGLDLQTGSLANDPTVLVMICGPADPLEIIIPAGLTPIPDFQGMPAIDLHLAASVDLLTSLQVEFDTAAQFALVDRDLEQFSLEALTLQSMTPGMTLSLTLNDQLILHTPTAEWFAVNWTRLDPLTAMLDVTRLEAIPEPATFGLWSAGLLLIVCAVARLRRRMFTRSLLVIGSAALSLSLACSVVAQTVEYPLVTIKKAGTGTGTILAGDERCEAWCPEFSVAYSDQTAFVLKVIPDADSTFVCWELADGTQTVRNVHVQPGDTVAAVFAKTTGSAAPAYVPNRVLVKINPAADPAEVNALQTQLGLTRIEPLDLIQMEVWDLTSTVEEALTVLQQSPGIVYVEPDYLVSLTERIPNDPSFGRLWGLRNMRQMGGVMDADIDASDAWDRSTGGNVVVGVIDTGVDYTHPDLAANMWRNPGEIAGNGRDDDGNGYVDDVYGYDFANNDSNPFDDNGHGTHCAGTIAGVGNNGVGVTGVNWSGRIMALKFLSSSGSGTTSNAVRALQYATRMGVKITSNSWGGGGYSQALYDAIRAAQQAGALFIAAAGNNGRNTDVTPNYPSNYPLDNVVSVAATNVSDVRATFSNYGLTSVDLGAPGVDIYSTLPNNRYAYYSGTSMATPHVAGAASLLWALNPGLTAAQVKQALLTTVDPASSLQGRTVTGGRLNLFRAVQAVNPTLVPDINVRHGNLQLPLGARHDLGLVSSGNYRYVIQNLGTGNLLLTGSPLVTLSGGAPAFQVRTQPAANLIAPNGELWFDVDFAPTVAGTYTTTVSIANNDPNEQPYTFMITGQGRLPNTPQGVAATDGTYSDRVRVTWSGVSGATYYRVYRGVTFWPTEATPISSWQTGLSYDDYSATPGQTYYYWVTAATNATGAYESWYSSSDTGYAAITTAKPDLVLTELVVTSWTVNRIDYRYTLKNIGNAPANLDGPTSEQYDNVKVQAFLSADTIFNNAGDVAAGGSIIGLSPLGQLAPGASFTGSFGGSVTVNLAATPYLTLKVDWGEVVAESNETNNTLAVRIPANPAPVISGVSPNPFPRAVNWERRIITISGANFQPGAKLLFKIVGTSYTYPDRVPTVVNSSTLTYNISVGPTQYTWTVQVINPDGKTSNVYTFLVR